MFGDVDELLGGKDTSTADRPRRKRPSSPAIAAMRGSVTPTKSEEAAGAPITLTMPITRQEVTFELKRIDPKLIDVSPENERIQAFLDPVSLHDILPSLKKHGQQKPGTLRPKANGRYELIEGSRRLAGVKEIPGTDYLALVGDVPDSDVRELSEIENKHQDVSPYEKAMSYQRQMENGEYDSWTQLGATKGISSSHINRYKSCVELDEIFVRIFQSPSDMPLSYGETIASLMKKGKEALYSQAKLLLKKRSELKERLNSEEIIKQLKSAVRTKQEKPTKKKALSYESLDGKVSLRHTLSNKGNCKLEIVGVEEEKLEKILSFLTKTLKVDLVK